MIIDINIDTVMRSGQVFSYDEFDGKYKVYSADKMCLAIPVEGNKNQTRVVCTPQDEEYWRHYFNADQGRKLEKEMMSSDNPFVVKCMQYSTGMTMLNQDFWEMIVSFIISQRNSIPAIRKILRGIRQTHGAYKAVVLDGQGYSYYAFPAAQQMKGFTIEDLQGLSLGYRDKYVLDAIRWFNGNHSLWDKMTHDEKIKKLQEIRGVGPKVANCIALFALNDLECFPVDVWIERLLNEKVITERDITQYKNCAGYLNQIIYFYAIMHKDEFTKKEA